MEIKNIMEQIDEAKNALKLLLSNKEGNFCHSCSQYFNITDRVGWKTTYLAKNMVRRKDIKKVITENQFTTTRRKLNMRSTINPWINKNPDKPILEMGKSFRTKGNYNDKSQLTKTFVKNSVFGEKRPLFGEVSSLVPEGQVRETPLQSKNLQMSTC